MSSLLCVKSLEGTIQVNNKEQADGLSLTIDEVDHIWAKVSGFFFWGGGFHCLTSS